MNPTFTIQPSAGQLAFADPPEPEIDHIQPLFNSMLTEDDTSNIENSFSAQKQKRGNASASSSHASGARRTLASGTVNAIQRNVGKRNAWERPDKNIAIISAWNVEESIAKVKTVIIQVGLVSITVLQLVVKDLKLCK